MPYTGYELGEGRHTVAVMLKFFPGTAEQLLAVNYAADFANNRWCHSPERLSHGATTVV